jgi:hypothetical protein
LEAGFSGQRRNPPHFRWDRIDAQRVTPDEVKARYFVALPATLEIQRIPDAWPNQGQLGVCIWRYPLNLSTSVCKDALFVEKAVQSSWIEPVGARKTDLPVTHLPLFKDDAVLAIFEGNVDHSGYAFVIAK